MTTTTQQIFQVGSRVYSGLYGGRDGIIYKINGTQKPETVGTILGFMSTGGNASFDVVFENGTISPGIPESIVRGVQWEPRDGIASADEIQQALHFADAERIRRETEAAIKKARSVEYRAQLLAKFGKWLEPVGQHSGGGKHAAKNIRKQLKKAFPGVKFSVTSDYNCVNVNWSLGPTTKAVDAIIDRYQDHHSDQTGDYMDPSPSDWTETFGGSKFVFSSRSYPDGLYEQVGRDLCALQHVEYNGQYTSGVLGSGDHQDLSTHVYQLLGITRFPVGYEYAGVEFDNSDHGHWCKVVLRKTGAQ